MKENQPLFTSGFFGERATGIEPAFSAWEADVLPLNYARLDDAKKLSFGAHDTSYSLGLTSTSVRLGNSFTFHDIRLLNEAVAPCRNQAHLILVSLCRVYVNHEREPRT